ncbi:MULTISPECIES: circadian clock KaiB family protein [Methanobacterium]|uniref:Circadian clock KaiB family protein n=1 Tax=Methanobacterium veterum TaxID=408577 RepID=A0A9E4ZUH5_9EURY|nr:MULTISPECIES: circadian clock KaiB family protein [Methanobacterium]MCZ3364607.1 circadian clock KaiB family protein [Methanobacterium veterum]MCZ3372361.1 circadian clock KaiB family protein [Methanobacterium veterum]
MSKKDLNKFDEFESALTAEKKGDKYVLRLFVAGINPKSRKAIGNLMKLLEENLKDQYELEIIDIYQQPIFAREGQIVAAPTLIKELPPPLRRFVGDMSNKEKLLLGLELKSKNDE